jgi:predicted nuclease with TOPRIM domain
MGSGTTDLKHPITPVVTQIQDSHARIRGDLDALARTTEIDEIRAIVEELPELLKEHFRDEEKPDGLYDELESLRPTIDSQLKFLREEHREILEALEGLQRQFREADEVTQVGELEQRHDHILMSAGAFLQLIRHHERIESRLVADTYYTEEGGSG